MPYTLPNSTGAASLTDSATTEAQQKTNLTNLRGFIAEMMGTDSTSRGAARSSLGIDLPTLAFSVGASAMTIALKSAAGADGSATAPVSLGFRSATLSSAALLVRQATAALSLVVSSGSTLGMSNATDAWLYVYALDNSGAIELAISKKYFGHNFIGSTSTEGGAGAADSGTVIYSTTARTSVPMRLLYAVRSNQTTAGTWAAVPVETVMADAFIPDQLAGQVMTDVSGSRALATNYTNSTNKTITCYVSGVQTTGGNGGTLQALLDGVTIMTQGTVAVSSGFTGQRPGMTFGVPPGSVYRVNDGGNTSLTTWFEMR